MGSAELMLILGLLLGGVAVFLFVSSIFASNSDKQQLSWASNDEPAKSKNAIINVIAYRLWSYAKRFCRLVSCHCSHNSSF